MTDYQNESDDCAYGDALAGRLSGPCPACGVDADEHRRECAMCGSSWYPHDPATDDPATAPDGDLCADCARELEDVRGWWEDACRATPSARRCVVGDSAVYLSAAVSLDAILDYYPWDATEGSDDGVALTEAIDDAAANQGGAYWTAADHETVDGAYVHAVRYHHGDDWRAVVTAAIRQALDDAGADAEVREAVLRGIAPSDDGTLGDGTHHERIALNPDGLAAQASTWVEVYSQMLDNVRRDEADEEVL